MFIIRQATEADVQVIIDLAEKTWWPAYSTILSPQQIRYMLDTIYAAETLRAHIESGSQIFLMLVDEHGPQAFASYSASDQEQNTYKLHKLYVAPSNQKSGYGRALVQQVMRRVSENGIEILELNVNRHNSARRFYESIGFRIIREEDISIGPYWMNDYVMQLSLTI
jgi:ribosomal protein S18 acetylase RimI-like enzyme